MSAIPWVYTVSLSNGVHNVPNRPKRSKYRLSQEFPLSKKQNSEQDGSQRQGYKKEFDLKSSRECHVLKEHALNMLVIVPGCAFCK